MSPLTRSQNLAVLSYANSRRKFGGEPIPSIQSRFISEIPEKIIDSSEKSSSKFKKISHMVNLKVNNIANCHIKVNQVVSHKIFGKGKVINLEGTGPNTKLTIMFFNNTRKKLIYKYANLKIIE